MSTAVKLCTYSMVVGAGARTDVDVVARNGAGSGGVAPGIAGRIVAMLSTHRRPVDAAVAAT